MLAATRSELVRLRRRVVLLGWFGLTALFAVLINTVVFSTAVDGSAPEDGGPGVSFPDLDTLSGTTGPVAGLSAAASLFGVVTLSFWAVATATDYSTGLIRLLVAARPRRWELLAGKVVALTLVTAAATTVALVTNVVVAPVTARSAGVSTDAWGGDIVGVVASAWVNAFLAMTVWGIIGLVLATLVRSSAVAISVGVGYVLVVESIVRMAAGDATWLPGVTLAALAEGGSAALSYGAALALAAAYAVPSLWLAWRVFGRRPVTD